VPFGIHLFVKGICAWLLREASCSRCAFAKLLCVQGRVHMRL
jgi:hypothetical protein